MIITFLKSVFLAKSVVLNPVPIDINSHLIIVPCQSISAINGGRIRIDVTDHFKDIDILKFNILQIREILEKEFPSDKIEISLHYDNTKIVLDYVSTGIGENHTELWFTSTDLPLDTDFEQIEIKTEVDFNDVTILWTNTVK